MKKLILSTTAVIGCLAAAPALADAPSFNYVQSELQHTSTSAGENWGWGVRASINPIGGWFVSGRYRHTNQISRAQSDFETYRLNLGYKTIFADTLALYATAGWAGAQISGARRDGTVVGAGLRANLLSLLALRLGASHYFRADGFNEYSAGVLVHILPFTHLSVGVSKYTGSGPLSGSKRWYAGLRWSF